MRPAGRFVLVLGAMVLLGFRDAIWSSAAVLFEYHNHPDIWWWGKASFLPVFHNWSLVVGVAAILAFLLQWNRWKNTQVLRLPPMLWMLGLFLLMFLQFSPSNPAQHQDLLVKDLKSIVLAIILMKTANTPGRLRLLLWVFVVGCGGFGIEAFRNPVRHHGRFSGIGGPDTDSDNFLAAHLALCAPILINFMIRGEVWEKIAAILIGPFVLDGLILTSSRARRMAVAILLAGSCVFLYLADQVFFNRMGTLMGAVSDTGEPVMYGQDEPEFTGAGRTLIWKAGLRMVADHPLGLGGGGFQAMSPGYMPAALLTHGAGGVSFRSAHNTFLSMTADYGIAAFFVLCGLLYSLASMSWRAWKASESTEIGHRFAGDALAIGGAFAGLMVTLLVGDRFHYDGFFWMFAFIIALSHCRRFLEEHASDPDGGVAAVRADEERVGGVSMKLAVITLCVSLLAIF